MAWPTPATVSSTAWPACCTVSATDGAAGRSASAAPLVMPPTAPPTAPVASCTACAGVAGVLGGAGAGGSAGTGAVTAGGTGVGRVPPPGGVVDPGPSEGVAAAGRELSFEPEAPDDPEPPGAGVATGTRTAGAGAVPGAEDVGRSRCTDDRLRDDRRVARVLVRRARGATAADTTTAVGSLRRAGAGAGARGGSSVAISCCTPSSGPPDHAWKARPPVSSARRIAAPATTEADAPSPPTAVRSERIFQSNIGRHCGPLEVSAPT